ncbi:DUF5813 family protein [Halarchaeum nitratireducens]|uniref:Uncharacterized protein n=1 Tax=Halarchaeum nitratireducens TaxID=489913 RepID=A0A830G6M9_9EURY|nr:DUF5813 family protein [Halarchaeum nitratireducens]GGN07162.1 hypothetical protein GCM10009021_02780 [Halarchaeum nitratireducens]
MSDGDIRAAFAAHPTFEDAGDGAYAPTTNDWDATVVVEDGAVTVTVRVPTLSASVTEREDVAPVVEDGWFETLALRLDDATNVTRAEARGDPTVERDDGDVVFEATIDARPENAGDDALAVVNYVEGTWFEGIIPGYDYREGVQDLRDRAAGNAQADQL